MMSIDQPTIRATEVMGNIEDPCNCMKFTVAFFCDEKDCPNHS